MFGVERGPMHVGLLAVPHLASFFPSQAVPMSAPLLPAHADCVFEIIMNSTWDIPAACVSCLGAGRFFWAVRGWACVVGGDLAGCQMPSTSCRVAV